ncbi:MAG: hypothetical protein IKJ20_00745 [Alistipes sp.]|nr:hypothetical protein [Alistipes sp.]MBR3891976.1 hypothetical protein [Alistipes sp.]
MKKLVLMVVAAMVLAMPAVNAQKVNTDSEVAKLAKVDAAIADAKKGAKAATWVAHAKAYADAYALPTKELGRGVPEQMLMMNVGRPEGAFESQFAGYPAIVYSYEYVDVYVVNGMIEGWDQKKAIKENLAETAIASYAKAYEMDPKTESKVAAGVLNLANSLAIQADALNNMGKVAEAAAAFELAFRAQQVVPAIKADPNNLYNAGMLTTMHAATLQGEEALAAFSKGEKIFADALAAGFKDESGNIYYYIFHCFYGQKEKNRDEYLAKAKEALLTGIKLYPKNTTILDGLMQFYTAEEGVGDPAELTGMIEASLKEDPTNYDLWFGRGRVYNAMKQYDECIKSFEKCVELRPDEFEPNFYTAYFIIEKANAEVEKLNSTPNMSYQLYEEENAKINLIFAEAIPWLEKAYAINPTDGATIEYLNMLCFRLRDLDGMMDKYNKYHELYMNR